MNLSWKKVGTSLLAVSLLMPGCFYKRVPPSKHYIPRDHVGLVLVEYGVAGEPPIELIDGYYISKIPEGGLLETSSGFDIKVGRALPSKFYYSDADSEDTPLTEEDPIPSEEVSDSMNGICHSNGQEFLLFFVRAPFDDTKAFQLCNK